MAVDRRTGGVVARHNSKRFQSMLNAENNPAANAPSGRWPPTTGGGSQAGAGAEAEAPPLFSRAWVRACRTSLRGLVGRAPAVPTAPDTPAGADAESGGRGSDDAAWGGGVHSSQHLRDRLHSELKSTLGTSFLAFFGLFFRPLFRPFSPSLSFSHSSNPHCRAQSK